MATCYRHSSRETAVSCSNCGRPICPDCMTTSPVGMRCPECARQTTKVRAIRATSRRSYTMTQVLIAINVIVFFAEGSSAFTLTGQADPLLGGSSWLYSHGLLFAPYIRFNHDYYLLVTAAFLHVDILHIASNMWVLYWVGRLLEPAIGPRRFIAIYAVGLLAGSLGVMILEPNSPTAGASGAIFGLMGAAFTEAHQRGAEQVRNQLVILIVFNLIITLSVPGISIGAHIGGLIGGGLATLAFRQGDQMRRPALGWAACVSLMVIAVAAAIVVADHAPLPG
jgi:membrane associated rhomboid family serine protease